MLKAKNFINSLQSLGIDFFTGVPDSLMSEFSKSLHFDFNDKNHIISTNEGSALGICMGYSLGTGRTPLIYMQNSGLGNIINPYTSLLNSDVYNIPFVLLVGWRGEPGFKDEPQHQFQGKITLKLLELLQIDYKVIDTNTTLEEIHEYLSINIKTNNPSALVVRKDTFEKDQRKFQNNKNLPTRKKALEAIVKKFSTETIFISTTGKLSRELYQFRVDQDLGEDDFYTVGGMGHASAISFGLAKTLSNKNIVCLDGDGSILMHMGHQGIIGTEKMKNFFHIVFNNSAHESVGGQPNVYNSIDRKKLFSSFGYENIFTFNNLKDLTDSSFDTNNGPTYIEIEVQNYSESNLPRPKNSPIENKENFIKKVNSESSNS